MTGLVDAQLIAAGVANIIVGRNFTVGGTPVFVGVWPTNVTNGPRAEIALIRAIADVHLSIQGVPTTDGPHGARLFAGVEYLFPLGPYVNTYGFIAAAGDSANAQVHLREFILR